jgi:LacI family transcriptional regulator
MRSTLRDAGRTLPAKRVVEADWSHAGGYHGTLQLLDADPDVTAVFVHNDVMAIGALKAMHERSRQVPADCSLVSCDDLPFAPYLVPPLTTVRIPFVETGRLAATLLLRRIDGETIDERNLLPVELIVRDSTAAPL